MKFVILSAFAIIGIDAARSKTAHHIGSGRHYGSTGGAGLNTHLSLSPAGVSLPPVIENVAKTSPVYQLSPSLGFVQGCYPTVAFDSEGAFTQRVPTSFVDVQKLCRSKERLQIYARQTLEVVGRVTRPVIVYAWYELFLDSVDVNQLTQAAIAEDSDLDINTFGLSSGSSGTQRMWISKSDLSGLSGLSGPTAQSGLSGLHDSPVFGWQWMVVYPDHTGSVLYPKEPFTVYSPGAGETDDFKKVDGHVFINQGARTGNSVDGSLPTLFSANARGATVGSKVQLSIADVGAKGFPRAALAALEKDLSNPLNHVTLANIVKYASTKQPWAPLTPSLPN